MAKTWFSTAPLTLTLCFLSGCNGIFKSKVPEGNALPYLGNGNAYSGVVSYYRRGSSYSCTSPETGESILSYVNALDVTFEEGKATRAISKGDQCSRTEAEVPVEQITFSKTGFGILSHDSGKGIHETSRALQEGPLEIWCQTTGSLKVLELTVRSLLDGGYSGTIDRFNSNDQIEKIVFDEITKNRREYSSIEPFLKLELIGTVSSDSIPIKSILRAVTYPLMDVVCRYAPHQM